MAVYYGFYNSINHDRCYDALQMSAIFDGIINDGIFMNVGTHFAVTANSGMTVNVGVGRAWFNHTWTWNDSVLPLTLAASDQVKGRIDTIVIEVNTASNVRANSIKVLKGTPDGSNPKAPALTNNDLVHQYPLADIKVAAGTKVITAANITNRIGQTPTKFVTGILQTINTDTLIAQWKAEWANWCTNSNSTVKTQWSNFLTTTTNEKNAKMTELDTYVNNRKKSVEDFITNTENTFTQADKTAYAARLVTAERFHEREDVTFAANGSWAALSGGGYYQDVKLTKKTYLTQNSNVHMHTCDSYITKANVADYLTQFSYISKAEIVLKSGAPYIRAYCYETRPSIALKVTIIGN